jgi:tetratricopeptide (TPR) repeat protein
MATKGIIDPRKTVMISSTVRDLPEHREQVRLACERIGFAPHGMMEHLTALDIDAIEASLEMVERADVYIGIFANRYGEVPDGYGISITEMEYDRAVQLNKPRLIFFSHEDHLFKTKDVETGGGAEKLSKLKDRIGKKHVAAYFKSADDLRGCVVEALTVLGKKLDADEVGDSIESVVAKLHRKSVIPTPPDSYIAHPYTLLQSRNLIGRQAELNDLTDWVANPNSEAFNARIFCLVAIGGMGKTALAWQWFNQLALNVMTPLAGRLWWSFYESDATFENFLNRVLCYVSGDAEEVVRTLPWHDRERLLLNHLSEKQYLLVLDGLERILIAYNRMDASSLSDDDYDEQTANRIAGAIGLPVTATQSFIGRHRLRQTSDPRAGAFLQKLIRVAQSRILITTRLYPTELQLATGEAYPGCWAYFVSGLPDNDAVDLWRALHVSGSRQELVPIFRSVDNHPLLVQTLASEVANYKKAPGNFGQWQSDHPQFNPTSLPIVKSRTHILAFALQGLSQNVREVLNSLVSFRMPTSYDTLEALLVEKKRIWLPFRKRKIFRTVRELDRALSELEDRGLIGWDREANRYDSHPIVRGVVWDSMNAEGKRAVLAACDAHFQPMPTPEWDQVKTLEDLAPAIERYHALLGLERFDDAFALFRDRLENATLYRLAAYRQRISWLEPLFSGVAPTLGNYDDQSYGLSALAGSYRLSGQPSRAIPLYRKSDEISEFERNTYDRQIVLCNLGDVLRQVGALREAEGTLRQALVLNRRLDDELSEAITLQILGKLLSAIRSHPDGEDALNRSWHFFRQLNEWQSEGVVSAILAQRALWLDDLAEGAKWANRAWELASQERVERDFIRAAFLQGQVALRLDDSSYAQERLHHALVRARAVNLVELELPILIAIAELNLRCGDRKEAKARLGDVWEAAELGPYPFFETDAQNVLAEIARAEGDRQAAIRAASKAYKAAWCQGPPYAYHWGLMKAKSHLATLGVPVPVLPAFDASKFPILPDVRINLASKYFEPEPKEKRQTTEPKATCQNPKDKYSNDYKQRGF